MIIGKFWLKYFSVSSCNSGNSARTEFVHAAVPCKVATNDEAFANLKRVVAQVTEILDARGCEFLRDVGLNVAVEALYNVTEPPPQFLPLLINAKLAL